jgi:hypothetical protein
MQPLSLFQYTKLYINNTPSSFIYFLIPPDWTHSPSKIPWSMPYFPITSDLLSHYRENKAIHSLLSPHGLTPKVMLGHGLQTAVSLATEKCWHITLQITRQDPSHNLHFKPPTPCIMFYKPVKPHIWHLEYTTFQPERLPVTKVHYYEHFPILICWNHYIRKFSYSTCDKALIIFLNFTVLHIYAEGFCNRLAKQNFSTARELFSLLTYSTNIKKKCSEHCIGPPLKQKYKNISECTEFTIWKANWSSDTSSLHKVTKTFWWKPRMLRIQSHHSFSKTRQWGRSYHIYWCTRLYLKLKPFKTMDHEPYMLCIS